MKTHNMKTTALLVIFFLATALTGCASKPVASEKLEPYQCGTVARLHTLGGVFLASQPSAEDFDHAKKGGIKTVINLRLPDEVKDFDEAKVVTDLGMAYHNIGFEGPDMLTDDVLDRTRALLRDQSNQPVLLHCSSANRVGAVWLAHRVLDAGLPYDEALAEAKTVGLKTPAYEQIVKNYIERHQSK